MAEDTADGFDVIVIGAGVMGLYALYRLRAGARSVCLLEEAGGVGGTWYWNTYPGCRFDSESYTYAYSFSPELLQEWEWSEHYAPQPETERYMNHVADRFQLRKDIRFNERVIDAVFEEDTGRWHVTTSSGYQTSAQFLMAAVGLLSAHYVPDYEGIDRFEGTWCHTGRWPREGIDVAGQRVGVVGTGATAVQLIPEIAGDVEHLTVFQRTPNYCVPLRNRPIDPETQRRIKIYYEDIFRLCATSPSGLPYRFDPRSALDVPDEERLAQYERLWAEPGFRKWLESFHDIAVPGAANEHYAAFVRQKIRGRVHDPEVADKLIPRDHPFGSKRPPCESGYYEVFNRDNVTLVDLRAEPIERVTPSGVKTTTAEYELDVLIFATGYDAVTGGLDRINIRGECGRSLRDKFSSGPETYFGMQSVGFPNLFILNTPGVGNYVRAVEPSVDWVAELLDYMSAHGFQRVSPTPKAEQDWTKHVAEEGAKTLRFKANSWYVGANIPGKSRVLLIPPDNSLSMRTQLAEVAAKGYVGFRMT